MALNFTAAQSSRISKSKSKKVGLSRIGSAAFSNHRRQKPVQRDTFTQLKSLVDDDDDDNEELSAGVNLSTGLQIGFKGHDVEGAMRHVQQTMFGDIPDRRSGLNSTRIAEILNFQRAYTPFISVAHIQCLIKSPTSIHRQISMLLRQGKIRKVEAPFRGNVTGAVEEFLVFTEDWKALIDADVSLDPDLKRKLEDLVRHQDDESTTSRPSFSLENITKLVHEGYAIANNAANTEAGYKSKYGAADVGTLLSMSRIGQSATGITSTSDNRSNARLADGSFSERATLGAQEHRVKEGVKGVYDNTVRISEGSAKGACFTLCLPGTGSYIRLLRSSVEHMMHLLHRSPYKECPLTQLRDKWNGAVPKDDIASIRRQLRGEFSGILPGQTKRWKDFYGVTFEFVLHECLGRGMLELFDTGSVGMAVRKIE